MLFICIKLGQRLFEGASNVEKRILSVESNNNEDSNDDEMRNIFDTLIDYKIRTFFVITQSEGPKYEKYKRFKKNLIVEINNIKSKYSNDLADKVFGENVEDQIIPICSMKTTLEDYEVKPFGLDTLFKKLYEYFSPKKILYEESKLIKGEGDVKDNIQKNIQGLIDNNELLNNYQSKKQFLAGLREKIESEASKIVNKYFLIGPKYLYTGMTEEIFFGLACEAFEKILCISQYILMFDINFFFF